MKIKNIFIVLISVFLILNIVLMPATAKPAYLSKKASESVKVDTDTGYKITIEKIMGWILVGAVKDILKKHKVSADSIKYNIDIKPEFGLDMKLQLKATIDIEVKKSVKKSVRDKIKKDVVSAIRSLAKLMTFDLDDEEKLDVKVKNTPSLTQKGNLRITIDALYD